jgi:hypothetical protein
LEVQKVQPRKKKIILIITISVMVLGIILYQLADRYLIQHVEMTNALSNTTSTVQSTESNNATTTEEDYNADDWSYTSDTKSIQIKKVEAGSSDNPIVYYVADVELKDASSLKSHCLFSTKLVNREFNCFHHRCKNH